MRKKSHIRLAYNIINEETSLYELEKHKKAFYFGNILPDCVPTFIFVRHNIEDTQKKLKKLLDEILYKIEFNTTRFWLKIGCILHYIADYFTYPHNKFFNGNFFEHNSYEKELKKLFKNSNVKENNVKTLLGMEDILTYLNNKHNEYHNLKNHNMKSDCNYINNICYEVFSNIVNIKAAVA